jgi:two-component system, cell cycle response regulator
MIDVPNPKVISSIRRVKTAYRILLIDTDESARRVLEKTIKNAVDSEVDLVHAFCLADAFEQLNKEPFQAVLLDLTDSRAVDSVRRVREFAQVPIIALTKGANDSLAMEALRAGADEYLVKQGLNSGKLRRAFQYATAREEWRREIYTLSDIDELTGLYNRRAFMRLGEQQLNIARRAGRGVNVAFADLDALKVINDQFGHKEGDRALRDVARILKSTFSRASDLLARIGGDEFGGLWIADTSLTTEFLCAKFKSSLESYRASERPLYALSLSIGVCQYHAGFTSSLSDMLAESDQRMYEDKCLSKARIA